MYVSVTVFGQARLMASQQFFLARYTPYAAYAFKDMCSSQIRFKLEYPFQGKEVWLPHFPSAQVMLTRL